MMGMAPSSSPERRRCLPTPWEPDPSRRRNVSYRTSRWSRTGCGARWSSPAASLRPGAPACTLCERLLALRPPSRNQALPRTFSASDKCGFGRPTLSPRDTAHPGTRLGNLHSKWCMASGIVETGRAEESANAENGQHQLSVIDHAQWRPSANPWAIAVSVMTATFMVVLDSSVANVALPHIAGSLSASTDEATWVLTSYLVSNAIMLPATGWITRRIGRKRLLTLSIILFTGASMLCGMAINMPMLIVARILQGVGGG